MSLGEDISKLVGKGDGVQLEIAFLEMLTSDVAVNFNVLGVGATGGEYTLANWTGAEKRNGVST